MAEPKLIFPAGREKELARMFGMSEEERVRLNNDPNSPLNKDMAAMRARKAAEAKRLEGSGADK